MAGKATTHSEQRRRLRRRLQALGVPEYKIERIIVAKREEQARSRDAISVPPEQQRQPSAADLRARARRRELREEGQRLQRQREEQEQRDIARWKAEQAEAQEELYRRLSPDDRRHRPTTHDPVTVGVARASGLAAKAAKRGRTLTKWQHDEAEARR